MSIKDKGIKYSRTLGDFFAIESITEEYIVVNSHNIGNLSGVESESMGSMTAVNSEDEGDFIAPGT